MPTYAYRCKDCEHQFEIIQKISEEPLTKCPKCEGSISRLLFPVGIVFKGSGFHVNDYPSSNPATSSNGKKQSTSSSKETTTTSAS